MCVNTEAVRSVYLAVDGRRLDAGNTWVPVRDRAELEVRCVAEGNATVHHDVGTLLMLCC